MENILIINSDKESLLRISETISQMGYKPFCAHDLREGTSENPGRAAFPIVFLEAQLPDGSGLDYIGKIKTSLYSRKWLSSPASAARMRRRSPSPRAPGITSKSRSHRNSYAATSARSWNTGPRKRPETVSLLQRKDIIGSSRRLDASLDLLAQAAQCDVNILLCGETGTGKELFAKAIHQNSRRAAGNFVIVDCTALPETLVESVLFGHMRGSFTGAYVNQDGLVKQADKGTLFLDEIGELPLSMQKSFLRVIQEHRFRPVGGSREVASDFRLVAATNRDLGDMVGRGQFREDLLFRLRSLVIELPSLRERREDIKELILHYMGALCQRFGLEPKGVLPRILEYHQPLQMAGGISGN